ncbi:MAG: hypothetical protein II399_08765 [Lachnospiraceae bacterium]|nr:hypothetical protein [Lachnospiraceae bacterium]
MDIKKKIEEILARDYDHEIPDKLRSRDFNKAINAWLRKSFPGCAMYPTKGAWCEASGFIEKDGKYVFYSFQDYRYWDWKEQILIRTAKSEKDYTGGANHYTNIDRMVDDVNALFDR